MLEPPPPSDVVCKSAAATAIPEAELPSNAARATLRGCDGEALYYGIGMPVDYERARLCALAEGQQDGASVIGGPEILMMLYANGRGVRANYDLALRFACQVGGAPAELSLRISKLWDARLKGTLEGVMDVCDDVTSGHMSGSCAAHTERVNAGSRNARKQVAVQGMPAAELAALDAAAKRYFEVRSREEVDMTGTMRAVFSIEEQAELEDGLVSSLEHLRNPSFLPKSAESRQVERDLATALSGLMTCKDSPQLEQILPGSITRAGIRKTHQVWLAYRQAFARLALRVRPESSRESWLAWLGEQRLTQLKSLSNPC